MRTSANARGRKVFFSEESLSTDPDTEGDLETESETHGFVEKDVGVSDRGRRCPWACIGFLVYCVYVILAYRWRVNAVAVSLAGEMDEEERAAVVEIRTSHDRLVEEARQMHANGTWPATFLELDLIGAGGGFRSAVNLAGAALLFALEHEGLIAGVRRVRGASAGSFAGLMGVAKLWEPDGFVGWICRAPRFFRDVAGQSLLWRFPIPFETWYVPSTLKAMNPGDYRRISGRTFIPYVRVCLFDGMREAEVSEFNSNEAVMTALSKSMMLPFLYPFWNSLYGLRDGEVVLDAGLSRDYPVFVDGLRAQIVLAPRPELNTFIMSPLPETVKMLQRSQSDVFDLLRKWDGRPASLPAAEIVPAGHWAAQCANARLNDWALFNLFRRIFLKHPNGEEKNMAEAWQVQQQYAFNKNSTVSLICESMAPVAGDPEPETHTHVIPA